MLATEGTNPTYYIFTRLAINFSWSVIMISTLLCHYSFTLSYITNWVQFKYIKNDQITFLKRKKEKKRKNKIQKQSECFHNIGYTKMQNTSSNPAMLHYYNCSHTYSPFFLPFYILQRTINNLSNLIKISCIYLFLKFDLVTQD